MNNVILLGRLTKDPELRETAGGTGVATFTLAIDDGFGEKKRTNFIPVKVFGKQAESCDKYLNKGSQCAIIGKIQTGSYQKKDGKTVFTTDVIAERVEFIGSASKAAVKSNESHAGAEHTPEGFSAIDEDIPF